MNQIIITPAGRPLGGISTADRLIRDREWLQERIAIGGEMARVTRQAVELFADYVDADRAGYNVLAIRYGAQFERLIERLGFNPLDMRIN